MLLLLLPLLLLEDLSPVGSPFFASRNLVPESCVVVEDGVIVLLHRRGREGGGIVAKLNVAQHQAYKRQEA